MPLDDEPVQLADSYYPADLAHGTPAMGAVLGGTFGERVAELRRRRGLSQKDLATEVGRSESWVSQVERDALPVEQVSVLRLLADALGTSVRELRPEAASEKPTEDIPDELTALRLPLPRFDVRPGRCRHTDRGSSVSRLRHLYRRCRLVDESTRSIPASVERYIELYIAEVM